MVEMRGFNSRWCCSMGWDCRLHVASSLKNLIPGLLSEKLSTVFQSGSAIRPPTDSEAAALYPRQPRRPFGPFCLVSVLPHV